jgi:uncharacterized phiE125 gp8 family phage protein
MSLVLNTPPATEPVSLAEAKAHLKVDTGDDDALISALISAARTRAAGYSRDGDGITRHAELKFRALVEI